jgi:hypothetical protein
VAEGEKHHREPQAPAVPMAVGRSVAGLMLVSQLLVAGDITGRKLAIVGAGRNAQLSSSSHQSNQLAGLLTTRCP